jgi:hypothetical protein
MNNLSNEKSTEIIPLVVTGTAEMDSDSLVLSFTEA